MKSYGIIQSPNKNSNCLIVVSDAGNVDISQESSQIIDKKNTIVQNGKLFSKLPVRLWYLKNNSQEDCFIELPCIESDDWERNIKLGILLFDVQTLSETDLVTAAERFDPELHLSQTNISTALELYKKASTGLLKRIWPYGVCGLIFLTITIAMIYNILRQEM